MTEILGQNELTLNEATMIAILQNWLEVDGGEMHAKSKITHINYTNNSFVAHLKSDEPKP